MFSAEVDTKSYIYAMKMIGHDALPHAVADTLNAVADANVKPMRKNVQKMKVRTPFTLKSIKQLRWAKGTAIERMYSQVGSISSYLWMHDKGYTKTGMNGGAIPIATKSARSRKSDMGIIRKVFRLSKSQNISGGEIGNTNAGRLLVMKPRGLNRRKGIYLEQRQKKSTRLTMLRNLETNQARLKPTGWFSNVLKKYGTAQFIKAQFIKQAQKRLRKYQ